VRALNGHGAYVTTDASLERVLRHTGACAADVISVSRSPSRFATLFPADVVTLTLRSGARHSVFVKRLGSEQADHPDKQRRDREIRVYEELLADERLPVPGFYGWESSTENGQRELFLEYVDDWNLRYHSLEYWHAAARALARLHGWFAERREFVRSRRFLLRIDETYVRAWAKRAVDASASISPVLGARLHRAVEGIGPAAALLAQMPPTLVHNDLSPKNVIADRSVNPARICFVDWELAGFGCGPLDLVHLRYGLEPADASTLWTIYRAELAGTDVIPCDAEEDAVLAACELHKTLYRLAHVRQWRLPRTTVEEWIAEVERLIAMFPRRRARPQGVRA
jgi:aminoglycoside phosphotransferase (APT) family kinase protein